MTSHPNLSVSSERRHLAFPTPYSLDSILMPRMSSCYTPRRRRQKSLGPVEDDPCSTSLPAGLGSLGEAASSIPREPYACQCVPSSLGRLQYNLALTAAADGTENCNLCWTPTHFPLVLTRAGIDARKLKAGTWLDPADLRIQV